jgi:GNAT superfamily N-acetyltransferase
VTRYDRASESDIPALSALLSLLFAQEAEFEPNDCAQREGLAAIIRNADLGAVLVARSDAGILGMVNLLFTVSTALGGRVAILEDMVIAPEARGRGIGSGLLGYAIELAGSHGIERITLLTDRENRAAQSFYSRHGFTTSTMVAMRRFI